MSMRKLIIASLSIFAGLHIVLLVLITSSSLFDFSLPIGIPFWFYQPSCGYGFEIPSCKTGFYLQNFAIDLIIWILIPLILFFVEKKRSR